MLALQNVACLLVIESLDVPFDERKIFAVVIGMTAGAILVRPGLDVVRSVQPSVGRNS